jgi:hypothetical protein
LNPTETARAALREALYYFLFLRLDYFPGTSSYLRRELRPKLDSLFFQFPSLFAQTDTSPSHFSNLKRPDVIQPRNALGSFLG